MTSEWTDERIAEYQGPTDREPEVEGPYIGELKPIAALVEDYANADPIYANKTRNLARTFYSWRRSKPDGGCGWRAIPFVLFELLLQSSNKDLIEQVHAHLLSLNDLLLPVLDHSADMVDEFTSTTFEVMQEMIQWLPLPNRRARLVDRFNKDGTEANIAYHFKLLASAQLTAHPDDYAPFLDDPIEDRVAKMKVTSYELDEISNQALYDLVLAPSGFGLEVLVLLRSPGDEVDFQSRIPETPANQDCTIRLLYRPGHYDIIYKSYPIEAAQVQVRMAFTYQQQEPLLPDDCVAHGLPFSYDFSSTASFSVSTSMSPVYPPSPPRELPHSGDSSDSTWILAYDSSGPLPYPQGISYDPYSVHQEPTPLVPLHPSVSGFHYPPIPVLQGYGAATPAIYDSVNAFPGPWHSPTPQISPIEASNPTFPIQGPVRPILHQQGPPSPSYAEPIKREHSAKPRSREVQNAIGSFMNSTEIFEPILYAPEPSRHTQTICSTNGRTSSVPVSIKADESRSKASEKRTTRNSSRESTFSATFIKPEDFGENSTSLQKGKRRKGPRGQ